jgi:hypothetical protein
MSANFSLPIQPSSRSGSPARSVASVDLKRPKNSKKQLNASKADFSTQMKKMKAELIVFLKLKENFDVNKKGGKLVTTDGSILDAETVKNLKKEFLAKFDQRIEDFNRVVEKKNSRLKKPSSQMGEKPKHPFYITDTLAKYLRSENYGNGLAMALSGSDDPAMIEWMRYDCSPLSKEEKSDWEKKLKDKNHASEAQFALERDAYAHQAYDAFTTNFAPLKDSLLTNLQRNQQNFSGEKLKKKKTSQPVEISTDLDFTKANVREQIHLVLHKQIATSGILISIINLIISVNQLSSKTNGQRVHYNDTMLRYFDGNNNTRWLLQGTDHTPKSDDNLPEDCKTSKSIMGRFKTSNLSVFEILRERVGRRIRDKQFNDTKQREINFICKGDEAPGTDNYGFKREMIMAAMMKNIIPDQVLDPNLSKVLKSGKSNPSDTETNPVWAETIQVQQLLSSLLWAHNSAKKNLNKKVKTVAESVVTEPVVVECTSDQPEVKSEEAPKKTRAKKVKA